MAMRNPLAPWWARLPAFWRRELGFLALWSGFGLLVMPFLIYLAGYHTLGPNEGDGALLTYLRTLWVAFFTATPSAWLLVFGPYLLFMAVRLLTRPLRRG